MELGTEVVGTEVGTGVVEDHAVATLTRHRRNMVMLAGLQLQLQPPTWAEGMHSELYTQGWRVRATVTDYFGSDAAADFAR